MKNISHENILNKRGPKTDPCGTPNNFFFCGLNSKFILVLCFLFDK